MSRLGASCLLLSLLILTTACGDNSTNSNTAPPQPDTPTPDPQPGQDPDPNPTPDPTPDPDPTPEPTPDPSCLDDIDPALTWPTADTELPLEGALELGQTHIVRPDDTRLAPKIAQGRDTLLLFEPSEALPEDTDLRIAAFRDGDPLGVLALEPPSAMPETLEARLTDAPIAAYDTPSWSAHLPHLWVSPGITLKIGTLDDTGALRVHEHTLDRLAAPHRFTITRTRAVLFGEPDFVAETQPGTRIARDFYATLPFAELRWVDTEPWRLDSFVIRTEDGPRRVNSEAERRAIASDDDHWSILKHQMALRLSLANTGRGLAVTGEAEGDSSPYSFGTSVAMGWFRDTEGRYQDIDDAPFAAGWTGWTAMWAEECGNGFIHEVGHSMTLEHFTDGTAAGWGIDAEYPLDGIHIAEHPWGYDTVNRALRTWFRVGPQGAISDENGIVGKHDPMNGGESPNAVSCFPQYTGYHAHKAQNWATGAPTIANIDGQPGIYRWNPTTDAYDREAAEPRFGQPIAVDVPTMTLIGTLGNTEEASQTYPPIRSPSGNVFTLPSPFEEGAHPVFSGARWLLAITYEDGTVEHAMIAKGAIETPELFLYSVNLDAARNPVQVQLFFAASGYPDILFDEAALIHTQDLTKGDAPNPPVLTAGRGDLANGAARLTALCEPGANCDSRAAHSDWRALGGQLRFEAPGDMLPDPATCTDLDSHSTLTLTATDANDNPTEIVLHAQRIVSGGGGQFATALHDETPWQNAPDTVQTLKVWLPYAENSALAPGRYRSIGDMTLNAVLDGTLLTTVPIEVDLEILPVQAVDLSETYVSPPLSTPDSSMYFLVQDPEVGPTSRVWWEDETPGPTLLRIPVRDDEGASTVLRVSAQHEACGQDRFDFNAGRASRDCEHRAILFVADEGNEALQPGKTYTTLPSAPLVIEGRRWHDPDGESLVDVFALDITYSP